MLLKPAKKNDGKKPSFFLKKLDYQIRYSLGSGGSCVFKVEQLFLSIFLRFYLDILDLTCLMNL
jgi:hypothetical protein